MLLWFLFAVLTALTLAVMLAPLGRRESPAAGDSAGAIAVYRDQLDEIEAERARGLVDETEAVAAKAEVSRRLLASASLAEERPKSATSDVRLPARRARAAIAVAALLPFLTLVLYLTYGSPGSPSYPMAGRVQLAALGQASTAELIARVEAQLREHPADGRGWDVIAPVYMKLGRFQEAATAFANASRLEGESVRRLAGFAEATVLAADGIVREDARLAFEKVLELEPGKPEPRFWLALAKEQDGKLAEALSDYRVLLSGAPAEAPWREAVAGRIAEVSRHISAGGKAEQPGPGPSVADVAAAEKLAPADRARVIAQMVDGLAERLRRDGRDLAGWVRLVNAYAVLDRKEDARAALAQARQQFPADEKALGELAALAKTLGLGS